MEQNTLQEDNLLDTPDLKRLFDLLRRNFWLLLLGLVVGGGAAYTASRYMTPIYEAKTQVMVTRSSTEGPVTDLTQALNSQQISQTYVELLSQKWVRDSVAERLGGEIDEKQVKIAAATNTQIINIKVEDQDPSRAIAIADMLVQVLIDQNESIQASRYTVAEGSLNQQIQQMETQIGEAQAELDQANAAAFAKQLDKLEESIAAAQGDADALDGEIANLNSQAVPDEQALGEKQVALAAQQALLAAYQASYASLLASEKVDGTSPEIVRLEKNLGLYQQIYLNLLNNRETVRLERMQNMPNVVQVNPAIPSEEPVRPRTLLNTLLGGIAGLIAALGMVFLIDYLDDTVKTPADVERLLGLSVIGLIADMQYSEKGAEEVYVARQPRSPVSEAFRSLRTNLEFAGVDRPLKTILVTSPGPMEGKTTVAVNLAVIFSQGGKRVALIDADMRRPHIHRFIGLHNRVGLSDLFRKNPSITMVSQKVEGIPSLMVITSGSLPPNPTDLLGSDRMLQVLNAIKEHVDVVIIDTPPTQVADAQVLAGHVDAVLMVVKPGHTRNDAAASTLELMRRAGTRVVGVVLNRIPRSRAYYYGGYQYSNTYDSYSSEGAKPAKNGKLKEKVLTRLDTLFMR